MSEFDLKTERVLKLLNSHSRIKKFLTILSYFLIASSAFVYVFHAFDQSRVIKLITDYKKKEEELGIEKVMTNPRINFQYSETETYHISAKKAVQHDKSEVTLFDVFAEGKMGKITAGELEIKDNGNHLTFSNNPILILNETKN